MCKIAAQINVCARAGSQHARASSLTNGMSAPSPPSTHRPPFPAIHHYHHHPITIASIRSVPPSKQASLTFFFFASFASRERATSRSGTANDIAFHVPRLAHTELRVRFLKMPHSTSTTAAATTIFILQHPSIISLLVDVERGRDRAGSNEKRTSDNRKWK